MYTYIYIYIYSLVSIYIYIYVDDASIPKNTHHNPTIPTAYVASVPKPDVIDGDDWGMVDWFSHKF